MNNSKILLLLASTILGTSTFTMALNTWKNDIEKELRYEAVASQRRNFPTTLNLDTQFNETTIKVIDTCENLENDRAYSDLFQDLVQVLPISVIEATLTLHLEKATAKSHISSCESCKVLPLHMKEMISTCNLYITKGKGHLNMHEITASEKKSPALDSAKLLIHNNK